MRCVRRQSPRPRHVIATLCVAAQALLYDFFETYNEVALESFEIQSFKNAVLLWFLLNLSSLLFPLSSCIMVCFDLYVYPAALSTQLKLSEQLDTGTVPSQYILDPR